MLAFENIISNYIFQNITGKKLILIYEKTPDLIHFSPVSHFYTP